jgi:hypothetical protein
MDMVKKMPQFRGQFRGQLEPLAAVGVVEL